MFCTHCSTFYFDDVRKEIKDERKVARKTKRVVAILTLTPTSNRGEMTPVLLMRPISSTMILPDRWSSTTSNSPIYPGIEKRKWKVIDMNKGE